MLARTLLARRASPSLFAASSRTYASAPASNPPAGPLPAHESYDPELEPSLAALGYPKAYETSRQLRKPLGWWDRQERINLNETVPFEDDVQSMWAPDVHKVKPFSAFSQLIFAFSMVGVFACGVYLIKAPAPALPRGYPNDGLVRELSGTDEEIYAARPQSANEVEE